jgi:phosphonate transport system substrate-binding protein
VRFGALLSSPAVALGLLAGTDALRTSPHRALFAALCTAAIANPPGVRFGLTRSARQFLCALGIAFCATQTSAAQKPYELGVFPHLPLAKIHELYAPMATDFEAKLRRQVQLSSKAGYAIFAEELRKQTYDIAFVQPFDYVVAHDKHGYLPLARRGEDLEAVIVVRRDSALKTIKDLKGRTVANPPVDAAVSHLTSMALRQAGIEPETGVKRYYGKNHFACLQSVLIAAADACGTAEQALRTIEKERQITTRFRILHRTVRIPHALFVVHRRVAQKDRHILLKTILGWPNTEEGKKILDGGQFIRFVAAKDSDYEVVRRYIRSRK